MQAKSNPKRIRLAVLFAATLAIVGAFALAARLALADDGDTPTDGKTPIHVNLHGGEAMLTVRNVVSSSDNTTEFDFTVKVGDDGSDVTYKIGDGEEQPGKTPLNVKLKGGQTLTVSNIMLGDQGTDYEVKEAGVAGWATKVGNEEKNSAAGTLTRDELTADVEFTNTKVEVKTRVSPPTIAPSSAGDVKSIDDNVTVESGLGDGTYTITGSLYCTDDLDKAVAQAEPVEAEAKDGKLEGKLTYKDVKVGNYAGKKLVSFVTVQKKGSEISYSHNDLDDDAQTVTIDALPPATTGTLTISKAISTPTTDKAIENAQADVDKATEDADKEIAQSWLDKLTDHRDGNTDEKVTGAKDKEFEFTVKLTDAEGNGLDGEFSYTGSKEGKIKNGGTVKLKHGESITVADLPAGAKYEVEESDATNWACDQEKNTVSGYVKGGEDSKAAFTNTGKGAFSISKTIKAAKGYELTDELKDTEFTFTVNFYDKQSIYTSDSMKSQSRKDVEGEFSYTGSKEGKLKSGDTVTLKGGEKITVEVDPGVYVRVSESAKTDWTQSAKNLAGAIYDGKTITANFTNTYDPAAYDTGNGSGSSSSVRSSTTGTTTRAATANTADPAGIAPVATMAVGAAFAAAGAVRRRK